MVIRRIAAVCAAILSIGAASVTTNAAEITVLSTTASKEALHELVPMFERASGHRVKITYGGGPGMADRVRGGIAADLFIGPAEYTDALLKEGKLVARSRVDFARSSTGVAVRAGAPRPDISTPEKLRAALLAAKSVSYSAGASGIQFVKVLERLGIAQQVQSARVALRPGEQVGAVVARGAAEIGVHQISQLLPVEGIEVLGPLPEELLQAIIYGVSVLPSSTQHEAAKEFVAFLRSKHAAPVIRKKGMEPL